MGKHRCRTSSFPKCAVPRNLGSCFEELFAFPCVSDCSLVIFLGRGWGCIRLTFLSQQKIPRAEAGSRSRGAAATRAPSVATAAGAQGTMGSGQDPCGSSVQAVFSREKGLGNLYPAVSIPRTRKGRPRSAGTALCHLAFARSLCKAAQSFRNSHQKNRSPGQN